MASRPTVYEVLNRPAASTAYSRSSTRSKDACGGPLRRSSTLLADGQVDCVMINSSRYYRSRTIDKKNFQPMWDGQICSYDAWFSQGAPNKRTRSSSSPYSQI
jgi:hypothetical protein